MNPTANYTNPNANYFQPGQGGNPLPANLPAPTTATMQADKINQPSTLNLQPQTPTPVPDITNITSTQAATSPTPVTPTASPASSLGAKLSEYASNLFGQSKNKEADLATQVQQEQAPYAQQLNEINTQIKMQQANAIANQEKLSKIGDTQGFASGEMNARQRTDAIETLKLSAIAEGLQGNLALAEKHATNAINAKYSQINSDIETAKTNIYNNYDSFTPAEKKKADQTLLRLDANDFFAKNNQDNEKAVQGIIQTAITQGQTNGVPVPNAILQKATALTDPTQAVSLLAPYLKDAAKIQQTIDQHNLAKAQMSKIYQDMQLSKDELALKQKAAAGTTVIDPITGQPTNELKINARTSAQALLQKVIDGKGTSAVGVSRIFGTQYIPGTNGADFTVQYDNLKSLLSLDNIKLLKGQGQVSDAERQLLSDASAKISLSQSEKEFKGSLVDVYVGLGGTATVKLTDPKTRQSQSVTIDANGLQQAKDDGLTITY